MKEKPSGYGTSMKKYYERESELELYKDRVSKGLSLIEERVIFKWLSNKDGLIFHPGCGCGREGIAVAQKGYRLVCMDLVYDMVRIARALSRNYSGSLKYLSANLSNLPFKDNEFEGAMLTAQIMGLIPGYDTRIKCLKETFRTLKRGGRIVLSGHYRNASIIRRIYFFFSNKLRWISRGKFGPEKNDAMVDSGRLYTHFFTKKEMIVIMKITGFEDVEVFTDADVYRELGFLKKGFLRNRIDYNGPKHPSMPPLNKIHIWCVGKKP